MLNRASSRFSPYPSRRPARGTADDSETQSHGGGTRTRNHLVGDSQPPVSQNVFHQQGSQAPIFNGPIAGGASVTVTNHIASLSGVYERVLSLSVLQVLYDHSATGAMHDSNERFPPPMCHPGTREAVVIRIMDWYADRSPEKPQIMWVHAPAGYGKTAIAGTISKMLEEAEDLDFNPLGATFFFWRTSSEQNNPTRFIVTITHQLTISIPELKPHIENAVLRNPFILTKTLEVQVVKLIVEPMKALCDLEDIPNRLVIIDGLDECINSEQESRVEKKYAEDQEKVQIRILDLIHTLQSYRLPLTFLILSRPEAWIETHMHQSRFRHVVEQVDLYALGDHMKDVEKYVRAELSRIATSLRDAEWPTEGIVHRFVGKTNGHMLYASTVIRYIEDPYHDPRKRLRDILDASAPSLHDLARSTHFSSLYELYRQILRSVPESNRSLMVEVLEDIIITRKHFDERFGLHSALATLDSLSSRAAGSGARAIRGLHAVLRLVSNVNVAHVSKEQSPTPFIHSSFVEFLTNPTLSLEFTVDLKKGSQRLLRSCLDCMYMSTSTGSRANEYLPYGQWKFEDVSGVGAPDTSKRNIQQDAHFWLAIQLFEPLSVMAWSNRMDAQLRPNEYVETVKMLLKIDLTTCFQRLCGSRTSHNHSLTVFPTGFEPSEPSEPFNRGFLDWLNYLPKESDPLSQQVFVHVLSSVESLCCNDLFYDWFRFYLLELYVRSRSSSRQKSDEVAQALSTLRDTLGRIFFHRRPPSVGWSSSIRQILVYIRQDDP